MVKNDNFITEDFLKKAFDDFRKEVKTMFGRMRNENSEMFGRMRNENSEMFGRMRNENSEMKDTILGELKAIREDFDAHSFLHQTTNDTLDNHETRLRKLEKPIL